MGESRLRMSVIRGGLKEVPYFSNAQQRKPVEEGKTPLLKDVSRRLAGFHQEKRGTSGGFGPRLPNLT